MLRLNEIPALRSPILVVMLTGWVDSGFAGAGAVSFLIGSLRDATEIGRYELATRSDLQQRRPVVRVEGGRVVGVTYPEVRILSGRVGRDVVVVHGPEPSLGWEAFVDDMLGLASRLDIGTAYFLGGMPAAVTHRRPPEVLATVTDSLLAPRASPLRGDYSGPTGAQSVLQVMLAGQGVDGIGLWAQIPPYLTAMPCPPAISALLKRLGTLGGIEVDSSTFDGQTVEYVRKVEEQLDERPDLAELVDRLEEATDQLGLAGRPPPGANTEDLLREIQTWLWDQDDGS